MNDFLKEGDVRDVLEKQGLVPGGGAPQALGERVKLELARWTRVVKAAGIKAGLMEFLEDLVAANRILAEHGVIDAYGHVSIRSPDNPEPLLPRALDRAGDGAARGHPRVRPRQQPDRRAGPIDVGARALHPRRDLPRTSGRDVGGAQPFAVGDPVQRHRRADASPVPHGRRSSASGLPNFEIRKVKKGSDLLVSDPKLGKALAKTLGKSPAALMRGHGAAVTGENLQRSVGRSIYLEMSAIMQMQAMAMSKKITFFDAAEVKASSPVQDYKRAWPLWRDKALAKAKADRK